MTDEETNRAMPMHPPEAVASLGWCDEHGELVLEITRGIRVSAHADSSCGTILLIQGVDGSFIERFRASAPDLDLDLAVEPSETPRYLLPERLFGDIEGLRHWAENVPEFAREIPVTWLADVELLGRMRERVRHSGDDDAARVVDLAYAVLAEYSPLTDSL